jgi:hypothetical protein
MATKSTKPIVYCTTCGRDVGQSFYAAREGEALFCDQCHRDLHDALGDFTAADFPIADYTDADWDAVSAFNAAYELRDVGYDPKPCEECGEMFVPSRRDAKTCSDRCRQRKHRSARSVTDNGHVRRVPAEAPASRDRAKLARSPRSR